MRARSAGLGFILVTLFLDVLGIGLVVPILPRLVASFAGGVPENAAQTYGWFAASYAVMQFLFAPLLGNLSDRFGRRPVLLLSLVGAAVAYGLLAVAPSLAWLFVGRMVAGITGASIGTATAYIADVSAPEKRAQGFALVGVAFGLGFIAGPALGGILGQFDVRLPFKVAAGFSLLNALYGLWVLPESLPPERRRPFRLARANPLGTLGTLARYPVVLALAVPLSLGLVAQRGIENVWALYTEHRFGWDPRAIGLSLAAVGLTSALVQGGLMRPVLRHLGERKTMYVSMSLAALSMVWMGQAVTGGAVLAAICLNALGAMWTPALQGLMSRAVADDEQGLLQGGLTGLQSLVHAVAPLISNQLFSAFAQRDGALPYLPGMPFFAAAGFLLLGLLAAHRAFTHAPERAPTAAAAAPPSG